MKQLIATFLLVSFLTLAFFGSVAMMNGQSGLTATNNCPFSVMGASLCSGDTLAIALHHVSLYYSFFNVLVSFGITASIILLCAALVAILLQTSRPLFGSLVIGKSLYDALPFSSQKRKMTRWLSLFELSPAV